MPPRLNIFLRHLAHYGVYVVGGAVIVVGIVALVLKLWLMPDVDRFRPQLEAAASRAVGVPVRIAKLSADWQGINPRLTLFDVRLQPETGAALVLPRVDAVGSWLSLAILQPHLKRLDLLQPHFPLRRSPEGIIYLAGIALNVPGKPSPFPDWLLSQPRIVINNAELSWSDEQLGAPLLEIHQVRLLIQNSFGRHRFGGVALPAHAASRIDLRGNLKGQSVHAPETWTGEMFAQVDQADLAGWVKWVPWAQQSVIQGKGDLRLWLGIEQAQAVRLIGDARLHDVAVNIQSGLPNLQFEHLEGRLGWTRSKTAHTLFVEKLRFRTPETTSHPTATAATRHTSEPANLRLTLTPDHQGGFSRIEGEASHLRLETMTALTSALPLPSNGHDLLAALTPHGLIEEAKGHWQSTQDFRVRLKISGAGARAFKQVPGFSGLDALIDATHKKGRVTLSGEHLALQWPQQFRHDLNFTHLDAHVDWTAQQDGLHIDFAAKRLQNADLDGTVKGSLILPPQGATPQVDIQGHLKRGEAAAVFRYLPHAVNDTSYQWIKAGLISGRSDNVRLVLKGDLKNFPFDKGGGEFSVSINMLDGVLDYAKGWPRIEGVQGSLVFHDKAMTLNATGGRILDATLGPVRVVIPDLQSGVNEMLLVDGRANGNTQAFLDFIKKSPVNDYTDHFTAPFMATGMGALALKINMPLYHLADTTVSGAFAFSNNTLNPGPALPQLTDLSGNITFTEKSVQGKNIQLRLLEMPAQLNVSNQPGRGLQAQLSGSVSADVLRQHAPAALAHRVQGSTQWQAELGLSGGNASSPLNIGSNLLGLSLDLPAPLGKTAAQALPLQVTYQPANETRGGLAVPVGKLAVRYGTLAKVRAQLPVNGEPRINIKVGGAEASEPTEAGIWITGHQRLLDLDAWRNEAWTASGTALSAQPTQPAAATNSPRFRQASIAFSELKLLDRRFNDTHLRVSPNGHGWQATFAGKEAAGQITTVPEARGLRVIAHLKRLDLPSAEHQNGEPSSSSTAAATPLSNVELHVESLALAGRDLGELRVRLSPVKAGMLVENLIFSSPEARFEASGILSEHPLRPTQLKIDASTQNLGKTLTRLGHADAIKGGQGSMTGNLSWMGGPESFNLGTLNGSLGIDLSKGQFLKVDPGVGRLVGVLSLQALPRRISLDFRDVFSQGFAFDDIDGQIHLEKGVAYMQNLRMNGPAAKVRMSGVVNLAAETQNLNVEIQPRLEDSVAVASAIIGGPVVGLGTYLASKILKDPIGQITSFEYAVSGTWGDPIVTKSLKALKKSSDTPP